MYTILKPQTHGGMRGRVGFARAGFAFCAALLLLAGCDSGGGTSESATNPNPDLRVATSLEALQALLYSPVFYNIVVDGIIEPTPATSAAGMRLNIADSRTVTLTRRAQLRGVTVVVYRGSQLVTESIHADWLDNGGPSGSVKPTKVYIRPGAALVGTRDFTAIPANCEINIFAGAQIKNADVSVGEREVFSDLNNAVVSLEVRNGQLGLQQGGKFYFGIGADGSGASNLPNFEDGHDIVNDDGGSTSITAFDPQNYPANKARLWNIAIRDEIALGDLVLHDPDRGLGLDPEPNLAGLDLIAEALVEVQAPQAKPVQIGGLTLDFSGTPPFPAYLKVPAGQTFVAANAIIAGEYPASLPAGLSLGGTMRAPNGGNVSVPPGSTLALSGRPLLAGTYNLGSNVTVTVAKDSYINAPEIGSPAGAPDLANAMVTPRVKFQDNFTFRTTDATTVKVVATTENPGNASFVISGKVETLQGVALGEVDVRPEPGAGNNHVPGRTYRIGEISLAGVTATVNGAMALQAFVADNGYPTLGLKTGAGDTLTGGTLIAREQAGTNEVTVTNARVMSAALRGALYVQALVEAENQRASFKEAVLNVVQPLAAGGGDRVDFILTSGTGSNTTIKAVGPKAAIGSENGVFLRETELKFALPVGADALDGPEEDEQGNVNWALATDATGTRSISGGDFTIGQYIVADVGRNGGAYVKGGDFKNMGRINLSGAFAVNSGKFIGDKDSRLIIEATGELSVGSNDMDADADFIIEGTGAGNTLDFTTAGPLYDAGGDAPVVVTDPDLVDTVGFKVVWKAPILAGLTAKGNYKAKLQLSSAANLLEDIFTLTSRPEGGAAAADAPITTAEIRGGNLEIAKNGSLIASAAHDYTIRNVIIGASAYLDVVGGVSSKLKVNKLTGEKVSGVSGNAGSVAASPANGYARFRWPSASLNNRIALGNYYGTAVTDNLVMWVSGGFDAPMKASAAGVTYDGGFDGDYIWFEQGNVSGWINNMP
jgi:hypothetical protein